jgi:hypothetical protein
MLILLLDNITGADKVFPNSDGKAITVSRQQDPIRRG